MGIGLCFEIHRRRLRMLPPVIQYPPNMADLARALDQAQRKVVVLRPIVRATKPASLLH